MGEDCTDDRLAIRARMDDRGRITIKEDDRIALGCADLEPGEKVLLEMNAEVVRYFPEDDGSDE